jgi:ABC-type sugar transport system permease subunit
LLGLGPPDSAPSLALFAIILVTIWFFLGFHTVVYLSGLTAIPAELLEAARMDGAKGWRLFRHITFPLLTPTTYFLLLVATIGAMTSFNLFYVLGQCEGVPLGTTRTVGLFIFNRFWCQTRLGYASAAAVFLMVIVVAITALNTRFVGRRVQYVD